jgi:hypothetical protein
MRIENAQKTITCIVDRRVLAELLRETGTSANDRGGYERAGRLFQLLDEVESGDRCELYARDWPTLAAGPGGGGWAAE